MRNNQNGVNWGYLIIGILFVITSLFSFYNPQGKLVAIVVLFAITAILKGAFELFVRSKIEAYSGIKSMSLVFLGVIDILIGVFLLFNINLGVIALPFIFATWFIIDSAFELFTATAFKAVNNGLYWFTVIISIIGIIVGLSLLFNPLGSALTLAFLVGFYFMWIGIEFIVSAFR